MKWRMLFVLLILALFTGACQAGVKEEPSMEPTNLPTQEPTSPALSTEPVAEQATEAPVVEQTEFYREEFTDADVLETWEIYYVTGNTKNDALVFVEDDSMKVRIEAGEETHLKVYNTANIYSDVVVQAEVENLGANDKFAGVMCRVSDKGWYEFRISPSGLYEIYRFDQQLKNDGQNPYILIEKGGSNLIQTGKKTNTFAMNCSGSDFTFYINDQLMKTNFSSTLREEFAVLSEGGFGIAANSLCSCCGTNLPVEFEFHWVETTQP